MRDRLHVCSGWHAQAWLQLLQLSSLATASPVMNRWSKICAGWTGPKPLLQQINNTDLDCELKQLALSFGTKILGADRAAELRPRLSQALDLPACGEPLVVSPQNGDSKLRPARIESAGPAGWARYVSPDGSDSIGTGTATQPYKTITKALGDLALSKPAHSPATIWLRAGTYYEQVLLNATHSGVSAKSPVTISAHPGERVVISGGLPLSGLRWDSVTMPGSGAKAFKAALPSSVSAQLGGSGGFTGLFGAGKRLTRARYPNCDDITGPACFSLNASGAVEGGTPVAMTDVTSVPGGANLQVQNQNGFDMFAPSTDQARATGPRGASDGTLLPGVNRTLVVDHPDYAWRCHDDSTFGSGFSTWRSYVPTATHKGAADDARFDGTFNEPFWDTQVSYGLRFNSTEAANPWAPAWTPRSWSSPETGIAHVYQQDYWGGWSFQIADRNDTDGSLRFACKVAGETEVVPCPLDGSPATVQGGWQEARGGAIKAGSGFYVENIKEELDQPGEWFFDAKEGDQGTLYLIPPGVSSSSSAANPEQLELVATIHKRVVSVTGDAIRPVKHIRLVNVTISHAEATYMDRFEVPSGGDWSIHRGGAFFADGAVDIGVHGCTFDQVDGSGVFLSRHVRNSTISDNSFFSIGETAVLLVGSSAKHRINLAESVDYPAYNSIARNLVDTVGVWVKQSAAYFKSIARENQVRENVFMSGPRSGVNWNDGALGGEMLEQNLILNFVRESDDHGPFNSWDRQPYIYRKTETDPEWEPMEDGTPRLSMTPITHRISQNLIFSYNFRGPSCASVALDHDDESSQYADSKNVLVHGGVKFFDGMDRVAHHNLVLFPQGVMHGFQCLHALTGTLNLSSVHTHFESNHCVLLEGQNPYNCGVGPAPFYNRTHRVDLRNNTFSWPANNGSVPWDDLNSACACWPREAGPCQYTSFEEWQAQGLDTGSRTELSLSNRAILAEARGLLDL